MAPAPEDERPVGVEEKEIDWLEREIIIRIRIGEPPATYVHHYSRLRTLANAHEMLVRSLTLLRNLHHPDSPDRVPDDGDFTRANIIVGRTYVDA